MIRALMTVLAAGLLAGCFYSEEALIGWRWANQPLRPGLYTHAPYDPESGAQWDRPSWEGRVSYRGRQYRSNTPNFPHQDARFRRLGGDTYIAQLPSRDSGYWSYGILFAYGDGTATYHHPSCADLTEAARNDNDIALDEEGACRLTSREQLEAVMRAYLAEQAETDLRIDGIYRRVR